HLYYLPRVRVDCSGLCADVSAVDARGRRAWLVRLDLVLDPASSHVHSRTGTDTGELAAPGPCNAGVRAEPADYLATDGVQRVAGVLAARILCRSQPVRVADFRQRAANRFGVRSAPDPPSDHGR